MKNILIIGATSAIAHEVAKLYAQEGYKLALVGRNPKQLDIIAADLKVRGAKEADVFTLDLNDFKSHPSVLTDVAGKLGTIDVVIIAHGILGSQDQADRDQSHLLEILNTNFVSYASVLAIISEKLKAQRSGTIAVLSSVAGDRGKQSNFAYGSAQAGKTTFTDGLRNRLFPYGVHVVTFKLGFVDTPMTKDFKKGALWASAPKIAAGIVKSIDNGSDVVYLPFFWRYIMWIIKSIPEFIFKKLKM